MTLKLTLHPKPNPKLTLTPTLTLILHPNTNPKPDLFVNLGPWYGKILRVELLEMFFTVMSMMKYALLAS